MGVSVAAIRRSVQTSAGGSKTFERLREGGRDRVVTHSAGNEKERNLTTRRKVNATDFRSSSTSSASIQSSRVVRHSWRPFID